jgi:hypothetical protein
MQDIFMKLIEQLNSSVFVLLAILIFAFYAVYKIGAWKQLFLTHSDRIEKVERISDTVISIQTKLDLIYQYSNPNATVRSTSPANLTIIGHEIVKKINAEDIFRKHAIKLIGIVEGKGPQNAYDIQRVAFDVCKKEFLNLLNENELKVVKEEAFSRGLLVEDIMAVFGILLRNKILEDKKIPIADVDKHAGNNLI